MNPIGKILFVDDEPNVLSGYERQLRKLYEVETAVGGADGLVKLASRGPFAVVVSDMRMPGIDGAKFLAAARDLHPDTVRILLTGYTDIQPAIDAVNKGSIFRFLTKPCPTEILTAALNSALEQHRLVLSERELLEKTLRGSVQVLGEILAMVNPAAFGRATRVQRIIRELAKFVDGAGGWEIDVAVVLSQLGYVVVPEQLLASVNRGIELTPDERRLMEGAPAVTRELLRHIPRLEHVIEIIDYKDQRFGGPAVAPRTRVGKETPFASRILTAAYDFETLTSRGMTGEEAIAKMNADAGRYDPDVTAALLAHAHREILLDTQEVLFRELQTGMVLAEDLHNDVGVLLLRRGSPITEPLKRRLEFTTARDHPDRRIRVMVSKKKT